MDTVCQACGYQRKPTDQAPDLECPSCGKAYTKTSDASSVSFFGPAQSWPSESGDQLHKGPARQARPGGPFGYIAVFGSALILIVVMLEGRVGPYQWPVMAAGLVMPCIAVPLAYACRDSLLREWGEGLSVILFVSLMLQVGGVGALALTNSLAFVPAEAWGMGILLAIPFWLVCAAVARSLNKVVAQQRLWLLGSLLFGLAYFYGGALIALGNRWLDQNSPSVYQATVIRKHVFFSRGGPYYVVTLSPSGPIPKGYEIAVYRSEFDAVQPGHSVICMAAYAGAFGITWGRQAPCTEQSPLGN